MIQWRLQKPFIQAEGPARGLHLCVSKTEIFWPTNDPRRETHGVFPYNISRPIHGVKLLGGAVSLDLQYYNDLVEGRVEKSIHLMNSIKKLKDPQSELLLLRNGTGVSKMYFTLRTTSPLALQSAITFLTLIWFNI